MDNIYLKNKVKMLKREYDHIGEYDLTIDLLVDNLVENDYEGIKEAKILCDMYFKRDCKIEEIKEAFKDTY